MDSVGDVADAVLGGTAEAAFGGAGEPVVDGGSIGVFAATVAVLAGGAVIFAGAAVGGAAVFVVDAVGAITEEGRLTLVTLASGEIAADILGTLAETEVAAGDVIAAIGGTLATAPAGFAVTLADVDGILDGRELAVVRLLAVTVGEGFLGGGTGEGLAIAGLPAATAGDGSLGVEGSAAALLGAGTGVAGAVLFGVLTVAVGPVGAGEVAVGDIGLKGLLVVFGVAVPALIVPVFAAGFAEMVAVGGRVVDPMTLDSLGAVLFAVPVAG